VTPAFRIAAAAGVVDVAANALYLLATRRAVLGVVVTLASLTEIITKGMRLTREDVYIANVVKCRPPENRNPEPDEVASCEPFLLRQLDLIQPRVIVALGKFAVQTLLRTKAPISRLRGQWHDYHGVKLMPTFHPAYLLRNPAEKRVVWEDIKQVMGELGIPVKP
jgi:DNA polymerase